MAPPTQGVALGFYIQALRAAVRTQVNKCDHGFVRRKGNGDSQVHIGHPIFFSKEQEITG
jgi:hypothetical protein